MRDLDRDGCADLVMADAVVAIRKQSPIAYRNNGSGQFRPMAQEPFVGDDEYFGYGAWPADVNGDGVTDVVVPVRQLGPDEEYGTDDDCTTFTTLLNTTPAAGLSDACLPA